MLTKGEIIDYINERLTDIGLFEYRKENSEYKLIHKGLILVNLSKKLNISGKYNEKQS